MNINDLIYVNNFGVSKIIDFKDDIVYIEPLSGTKGVICVKQDSKTLRKLSTKEEIDKILIEVANTPTIWVAKFIERSNLYTSLKNNPTPLKRFVMLKTIYEHYKFKKDNKIKGGLATKDIEFFRKSLSLITLEFTTVLNISVDELKNYISTLWNNDTIYEYYLI